MAAARTTRTGSPARMVTSPTTWSRVAVRCATSVRCSPGSATYGQNSPFSAAYAALVDGLNAELADWITAWAPRLTRQERDVLASLGVNGILGARFATSLFHQPKASIPDGQYLAEWTAVLATRIETPS